MTYMNRYFLFMLQALIKANYTIDMEEDCYAAIPSALRIIPRTLLQNAGGKVIRSMNELEKQHNSG